MKGHVVKKATRKLSENSKKEVTYVFVFFGHSYHEEKNVPFDFLRFC